MSVLVMDERRDSSGRNAAAILGAGVLPSDRDFRGCAVVVTREGATVFAPAGDVLWILPFTSAAPAAVVTGGDSRSAAQKLAPVLTLPSTGRPARRPAVSAPESNDDHPAHPEESLAAVSCPTDAANWYRQRIGEVALLTAEQEVDLAQRIEAGLLAERRLGSSEAVDPQVRSELEWIATDGKLARLHLIEENLRLVVHEAHRYVHRGVDLPDLVQAGNLGLMHAVELFDYRQGYRFSTYATNWIRQSIRRAIANEGRTVRLPVHRIDELQALAAVRTQLSDALNRDPSAMELADAMGVAVASIEALLAIEPRPMSLDVEVPTGFDAGVPASWLPLGRLIEDGDSPSAFAVVEHQLMKEQLESVLETLSEREATVIRLRFGMVDGQPKTLAAIGEVFSLSRERVRQIESRTMAKLQHPSRSRVLRD